MKARRRHELKSHELADSLEQLVQFLREHGSKVLTGLVVVVLAASVGFYLYRNRQISRQQGWQQLYASGTRSGQVRPDDLQRLAEQTSDEKLAALAWKRVGDMLLAEYLFADEADRPDIARRAQQAYQTVLDRYSDNALAAGGARMGLAILRENLGQWDAAKKDYEQLAADRSLAGLALSGLASQRLKELDQWRRLPAKIVATAPAATKPAPGVEK